MKRTEFGKYPHTDTRFPEIVAERCVHNLPVHASCSACADVCPRSAWLLDEDALALDTESCDGCALCISACPQGAIGQPVKPLTGTVRNKRIFLAACEYTGGEGEGVLPCVHALGIREILEVYRNGITELLICRADCPSCERGKEPLFDLLLRHLNALFSSRGLKSIQHSFIDREEWQAVLGKLGRDIGPEMSRRDFFRRGLGRTIDNRLNQDRSDNAAVGNGERPTRVPADYLPAIKAGEIAVNLPLIDAANCVGCDACIRICGTGALQLLREPEGYRYTIDPDQCTGCGVCTDLCEQHAIQISHWQVFETGSVMLAHGSCKACGAGFHRPAENASGVAGLCTICSQKNHNRNLYQVLD